jgi:hypothetical protein
MIRQTVAEAKLSTSVQLEVIEKVVPQETIEAVIAAHGLERQRQRKLSAMMGLLLWIGMYLFQASSQEQVVRKLTQGVRFLAEGADDLPASKGAICQLRYAQGARAMADLFQRVCRPMAKPDTPGAFYHGLRLMGMDGTEEAVADSPDNAAFFGRHTAGSERGEAAYPQLKAVHLVEIGTHAIVDSGVWPVHTSEKTIGKRLVRSLQAGMLVMWDAGFHSLELVKLTLLSGAQLLTRLPANVRVEVVERLPDGSTLIDLVQRNHHGRPVGTPVRLRLIEYTVDDPALPGCGERRRLITSLLDWQTFPALELARLYHERWEVEITIDETDTHQRRPLLPFRSRKPVGVLQEFYGLLIAHYIVRKIMLDAAQLACLDPDRLSFTTSLQIIAESAFEFQIIHPDEFEQRYQRLLRAIALRPLPPRVTRSNPRVVKRKMSSFKKKRPSHMDWPQPSCSFPLAIRII